MDEIKCCFLCKHHTYMAHDEFMCGNEESPGYGLSVMDDDVCEEFEEREES